MNFDIDKHVIYKCIHGSTAYGTNTPESDIDYKGVAVAPLCYYFGFLHSFEQCEKYVSKGADKDETIYDVRKFIKLASSCNPNLIEVLFCDESDIIFMTPEGKLLRDNAKEFLSTNIKNSFCGYAVSQLKKIQSHRRWLLEPPKKKPERVDFGLPEGMKISKSELNAYEAVLNKGNESIPENIMVILQKEKQYSSAKQQWDAYKRWEETRNPKRAILERKYGYDTKFAYHLVRLLRMGREILEGKGVIVKRPDRDELLAIRNGAWKVNKLIEYAETQLLEIEEIEKNSILPKEPNRNKLDELCVEIINSFYDI